MVFIVNDDGELLKVEGTKTELYNQLRSILIEEEELTEEEFLTEEDFYDMLGDDHLLTVFEDSEIQNVTVEQMIEQLI